MKEKKSAMEGSRRKKINNSWVVGCMTKKYKVVGGGGSEKFISVG